MVSPAVRREIEKILRMKTNDLAALRRTFDGGQGERPSTNAILALCDEVEALRAANAALAREIVELKKTTTWGECLGYDGKPRVVTTEGGACGEVFDSANAKLIERPDGAPELEPACEAASMQRLARRSADKSGAPDSERSGRSGVGGDSKTNNTNIQ